MSQASQFDSSPPPPRARYRHRPRRGIQDRIAEYVAHMTPGGIMTSNFMAMCEVAADQDTKSAKCRACKGLGYGKGDPFKIAKWQKELSRPNISPERAELLRERLRDESLCQKCCGTGFRETKVKREAFDATWTTARCERCKGCGEIPNEDLQDVCPRCLGDMCVVPATVKRTGSSKKGRLPPGATAMTDSDGNATPGGVWSSEITDKLPEFDEEQLDELVRTANIAKRVDPAIMAAVAAWEGPDGMKWAPTKWGRLFSLWPLTVAGKKLFEEAAPTSRQRSGFLRRPIDVLAEVRESESRADIPSIRYASLFRQADWQARELAGWMRNKLEAAEAQ